MTKSPPGASAHVQRRHRQPHRIDSDHLSSSRVQAAKSAAASLGPAMHDVGIDAVRKRAVIPS